MLYTMLKKLSMMLHCRCARCGQGYMFKNKLRTLKNPIVPTADCHHCGLHYELEPGFFWGAMYFSYAIGVGISAVAGLVLYIFFDDPTTWIYVLVCTGTMLAVSPLSMRYARVLMLYLFGEVNDRQDQKKL
jgi:uncharacterized protein (DUF983 family)